MTYERLVGLSLVCLLAGAGTLTVRLNAATVNAASASLSDVQAAINTANGGDTVVVPAGTPNWAATLSVNKSITLQGSGRTSTVITNTTGQRYGYSMQLVTGASFPIRITGFGFHGRRTSPGIVQYSNQKAVRIDNCGFTECVDRGILVTGVSAYGVIDHCVFQDNEIAVENDGGDDQSWNLTEGPARGIGTTNGVYVEDCVFNYSSVVQWLNANTPGTITVYVSNGGRMAFRHNTVTTTGTGDNVHFWDSHGNNNLYTQGGLSRGTIWTVIEDCNVQIEHAYEMLYMRGGMVVMQRNAFTSPVNWYTLTEEECWYYSQGGLNYGAQNWTSPPRQDQITNSWFRANTFNGVAAGASRVYLKDLSTPGTNVANCIKLDRDYFFPAGEIPPYDSNTLLGYNALVYPHPMVPGSPPPNNTLQLSSATYSVNENAGTVTITITRSGNGIGAVGVNYATAPGTALSGVNYTTTSGTKTWVDGDMTSKSFTVPILVDGVYASDKTFTVNLTNPSGGAVIGSIYASTVTVVNTDPPPLPPLMPGLSFHAYEGQLSTPGGTNASGQWSQPSTTTNPADGGKIAWRFTAPSDGDYTITATVNAPDSGANSFFVDIDNDPPPVPTAIWSISPLTTGFETRQVSWLGNGTSQSQFPTNAWTLTAGVHTLYIRGREANTLIDLVTISKVLVPGTIQLANSTYSVNENAGSISIPVRRIMGSDGIVGISYHTANGTAVSGVNYTAASSTKSWADGNSSDQNITITILDDAVYGPDLTFTLTIDTPTGGATLGSPTVATVTILNTTPPPPGPDPGVISITSASYSVNEDAGLLSVALRRSGGTNGVVGVSYLTANNTAIAGVNYASASGTKSWADGNQTDQTFNITIIDDGIYTNDLSFFLRITNATGGATINSQSNSTITVLNVNPPPQPPIIQELAWTSSGQQGSERNPAIIFYVQRNNDTNGTASATYNTSDVTAISGVNYVAQVNKIVSFTNGQSIASIEIPIINDQTYNPNRSFNVTLSNPVGAILADTTNTTGTIIEASSPPDPKIRIRGGRYKKFTIRNL